MTTTTRCKATGNVAFTAVLSEYEGNEPDGPVLDMPLDNPASPQRTESEPDLQFQERRRLAIERQEKLRACRLEEAKDREAVHTATGSHYRSPFTSDGEPVDSTPQRLIGWTHTSADEEEVRRQNAREEERAARDRERATRRHDIRHQNLTNKTDVNWFWASQMDVFPGYWVTPWFGLDCFYVNICFGAVAVVLESLLGFSNKEYEPYVRYVIPARSNIYRALRRWAPTPPHYLALLYSQCERWSRGFSPVLCFQVTGVRKSNASNRPLVVV
jgi:hypothetical protein